MNQFDFNTFNNLMKSANAGLKLALATNLMRDVVFNTHMYRNPLEKDANDILDEMNALRDAWKAQAAKRIQNDSSERSATIDNEEALRTSSTSANGGKVDQPMTNAADHTQRVLDRKAA